MLQRTINILTWTPFSYGYNQGSVLIWAICAGHAYCKCVRVHVHIRGTPLEGGGQVMGSDQDRFPPAPVYAICLLEVV